VGTGKSSSPLLVGGEVGGGAMVVVGDVVAVGEASGAVVAGSGVGGSGCCVGGSDVAS
jgi:hypothetical protein